MTQLILEIPQRQDISLLLALCKRLNIRVIENKQNIASASISMDNSDQKIILQGLPTRTDFEAFVQDFEESRKDKSLDGRKD